LALADIRVALGGLFIQQSGRTCFFLGRVPHTRQFSKNKKPKKKKKTKEQDDVSEKKSCVFGQKAHPITGVAP
jgi:hypothetical protein